MTIPPLEVWLFWLTLVVIFGLLNWTTRLGGDDDGTED